MGRIQEGTDERARPGSSGGRLRRALRWVLRGRPHGLRSRARHRLGCSRSETPAPPSPVAPTQPPVPVAPEGFVRVCADDELQDGEIAEFIVRDVPVALARVDGVFYALNNVCPHAGGPLGDGVLEGTVVSCPWHGWNFDVTTGVCQIAADLAVPTYSVRHRDGVVWVELPSS